MGLGADVGVRSLDSAGGGVANSSSAARAQLLQKRYQEVVHLEKAKKQRLNQSQN